MKYLSLHVAYYFSYCLGTDCKIGGKVMQFHTACRVVTTQTYKHICMFELLNYTLMLV